MQKKNTRQASETQSEHIIVEVEAARLELDGDIWESSSQASIPENGKVSKPFSYNGKFYIAIGGTHLRGESTARAHEIVPEADYEGEIIAYRDADRNRPGGFYNGMRVLLKNKPHVLKGPEITFVAKKKVETAAVTVFADTVIPISVAAIQPSPFEPQARRRARFKPEEIESLGNSIRQHGLAQPILVRPVGKLFEIVFGERRFLAVKNKGVTTINCFVRELSDAQVLELQYEENHRRQENDPLDDAFFFKFLKEKENYTEEQLASRLNTTRANVTNKLVLNNLIPDAQRELTDGRLPLKHAYFLARFPEETQKLICKEQYAYKYHDRDEGAQSYKGFVEDVETEITRRLSNAPFQTTDSRLHIKGLICPDCPERTGYAPALFTDLTKDDACLNKSCFEQKTNVHLRLKRDELAARLPNPEHQPIEEKVKKVPLVTDRVWADKVLGEKPLVAQKFLPEPECEFSEISLIADGAQKGQSTYICRKKSCVVHNPQAEVNKVDAEKNREALEEQISQLAREKVLAKAIEFFTDYKPIWMYDDLIQKLLVQLWYACDWNTLKPILRIVKDWKHVPKNNDWDAVQEFVRALDKQKQSQLLFLFIFKSKREDEIKQLATDYARTDYRLLDAEARLELAPPEEREVAEDVLTLTRAGLRDLREPDFVLDEVH